ncbi:hypothetical protein KP509_14G083400 [Ceratopteris richardii]|uniref:Uncharacterized protein n=1 Tax=Ceratopteris richardii TaxID=49495 RepID=A0A8T2TBT0_CERRI|nr:hypothetical protein KP509_14G083400 [Ceratopteris richardii]
MLHQAGSKMVNIRAREELRLDRANSVGACTMKNPTGDCVIQVWADHAESVETSAVACSNVCSNKRLSQNVLKFRNPTEDKENIDPLLLFPQSNRSSSSVASHVQRYPLQDITSLISLIQLLQSNRSSSSVASRVQRYPWQDITSLIKILQLLDVKRGYEASPASTPGIKDRMELNGNGVKVSSLLQMR